MSTHPVNKIPRDQSDAYMEGWGVAHRDGLRITDKEGVLFDAWCKGFDDCKRGAIDADYALGPDKLP